MIIGFYTPSHRLTESIFGAATFGFVGKENENEDNIAVFSRKLNGLQISGTYEECLNELNGGMNPKAAIVLLGNACGENQFLEKFSKKISCPTVGGGAAFDLATEEKGLISDGDEANIFLVLDDNVEVETEYKNIHTKVLGEYNISFSNPRVINKIDGHNAIEWLAAVQTENGVDDFEHMTFSTMNGVNVHLSITDGELVSGRDLEERMILRRIDHQQVFDSIRDFYEDKDAIVFGCAGLKGILDKPLQTKSMGLFMFGEVCYVDSKAEFGNLMLSKIRFKKK